jgi:hypothetical protein
MNTRRLLATSGVAAALALVPATSADAAPKPQIDVNGLSAYSIGPNGAAVSTGRATGVPFDGRYRAVLRADDGTLPAAGECEPGTATLRIDASRGRYLQLSSDGEVCGVHVQAPSVVTHVFTGTYDVVRTSERKLRGGDGFLEVRLADDGRASVFAIDT